MIERRTQKIGGWTIAGLLAAALAASAAAAAPSRKILQETDLPPTPQQAATLGTVDIKAGETLPWHTHPGLEIGYVSRGEAVIAIAGQPEKTYKAGESFIIPRGAVHTAHAAPTGDGQFVVTWITDKGAPLAIPAAPPK